eukprot:Phypoly_transcript_05012.p1 GENE.Phypoly_transcript_05012~~Phypoly_transcript_05012.p1  ORF type:complete len:624 (+),score=137.22 Phypoly_transcript_05012:112-1983(+)
MFFGAKKEKGKSKSKVFGVDLDGNSKEIPPILETCVVYLDATGLEMEGVFRKSGSVVLMNQYKAKFDNGEPVDFSDVSDPHIVAGLLKMFIREYPEPLLTFELYDCFLAAVAIPDINTKIPKVKQVLEMLPEANLRIVRYLVSFLCRVTAKSSVNLMTPQNLAIVFAPNLLRPPYEGQEGIGIMMEDTPYANELLQLFINNYDALFLDTIKPVAAAQKAQPTPPIKSVATPSRPPILSPPTSSVSARIISGRSPNPLPTPPASEETPTGSSPPTSTSTSSEQEPEEYPTDLDPFSSPEPPPKPPSRFANGPPPDKPPSATQSLPAIPENKPFPPVPPRSHPHKAQSEIFSPPNPPPKPSRNSIPPTTSETNPFAEEPTSPPSPTEPTSTTPPKTVRSPRASTDTLESPPVDTNPFAQPAAPPKPSHRVSFDVNAGPRNLSSSKSTSSIPAVDSNPFSTPVAPPKPSHRVSFDVNAGPPQPPTKPPRFSTPFPLHHSGDINPFSPPPRPPRDLNNSSGIDTTPLQKPSRSPSLNSVNSGNVPLDLNPVTTPAPPPKPTRANHKHNKSLPNTASLVSSPNPPTSNSNAKRPPSAPMPALYPPLSQPSQTTPVPSSQLYPVLAESK